MTYEADLFSYLSVHADGTALRALVPADRIYWATTPQGPTFPLIKIDTIDTEPGFTLAGDNGLQITRLQFSIMGPVHTVLVSIREALRALLHGKSQLVSGSTNFQSIVMEDSREVWVDDDPSGYLNMPTDFQFIHSNT